MYKITLDELESILKILEKNNEFLKSTPTVGTAEMIEENSAKIEVLKTYYNL